MRKEIDKQENKLKDNKDTYKRCTRSRLVKDNVKRWKKPQHGAS